ncbi:MAG: hypothetical protein IPJ06_10165 [Saprospiraceae bacterium]|nr:hypothetical protein [Saprospiraceae bacterium]
MKSRMLTLLLCVAMATCSGQESPFPGHPQAIELGMTTGSEMKPVSATLRTEGLGPLDSIKVWDNLTGKLITMQAFTYDKVKRVIRKVTYAKENSYPYGLEEFVYPGNDTVLIRSRGFRKYFSDAWTMSSRTIQMQVDSPNTQVLSLDWDTDQNKWLPLFLSEEVYYQDGSFRHQIKYERDIFSEKLIPTLRNRPIYNSSGQTVQYLFETDYDQDGGWDPSTRWVYDYIQDTILHQSTLQYWNSIPDTWTNNSLVQYDWLDGGTILILQSAKWDNSIGDWYLFQTRVTRKDESGRDLSRVSYDGPWSGMHVPEDSIVWQYNADGQKSQEIYFTWKAVEWAPYHLYRYGRDQCIPYPGRLDSVWVWNQVMGDWQLGGYESCHAIHGSSLIIEVDSLHQEYSWQNVDMKVHYYYRDSMYVAPPPIDSSSLQECIYMNPYQPGSPITCFTDLGLTIGRMNIVVVNLLGQVIHQDQHEVGLSFSLPSTIDPGVYVLEVSLHSGPRYSGLIQISN